MKNKKLISTLFLAVLSAFAAPFAHAEAIDVTDKVLNINCCTVTGSEHGCVPLVSRFIRLPTGETELSLSIWYYDLDEKARVLFDTEGKNFIFSTSHMYGYINARSSRGNLQVQVRNEGTASLLLHHCKIAGQW